MEHGHQNGLLRECNRLLRGFTQTKVRRKKLVIITGLSLALCLLISGSHVIKYMHGKLSSFHPWSAIVSRSDTPELELHGEMNQRLNVLLNTTSSAIRLASPNHAKNAGFDQSEKFVTRMSENVTIKCHFPNMDPEDPQIVPFLEIWPPLDCSYDNTPRVVDVVDNELRIDPLKVKTKIKPKVIDFCKYRNISMKPGQDHEVLFGPWSLKFQKSTRIGESEEFLQVECYHNNTLITTSYHCIARIKPAVEKARMASLKQHMALHSPKETLNLLLVGVDGISRENAIRAMPQTRGYLLNEMKAIEFTQFNKLGLNTFPNFIPLLTGLHENQFRQSGWDSKTFFDAFNNLFIWNHYRDAGYRTVVLEDAVRIAAFHHLKKGWKNPPFDYYPRPLNIASENDRFYRKSSPDCMGDEPEVTYMLDYFLRIMALFNSSVSKPYFLFSFFSRLTHDYQNSASKGDGFYLHFLQQLTRRKLLENTLLVFFSDHGARYGSFRNTYNGVYEARHPMLYFVFPSWFEQKYPDVMFNFRNNANRLTTFFDVHETLKNLLTFTGKPRRVLPTDRGITLFSEIPMNRTCEIAGIPLKYCGCVAISRDNKTSPTVSRHLINRLLQEINIETEADRGLCALLKLKETVRVGKMTQELKFEDPLKSLYYVTIMTTPGDGLFEASMTYRSDNHRVETVGHISRISMYRGQAECVDSPELRSFCYCKQKPKLSP